MALDYEWAAPLPDFAGISVYELWAPVQNPAEHVGWQSIAQVFTNLDWAIMNCQERYSPRAIVKVDPDGTRTQVYYTDGQTSE